MEAMHKKARGAGKASPGWIERKNPAGQAGFFHDTEKKSADLGHISGLGSFLSLHDFEFDFIALGE